MYRIIRFRLLISKSPSKLPLRLPTRHKLLQNPHPLLQRRHPHLHLLLRNRLIRPLPHNLPIHLPPIRRRAHRHIKHRLNQKRMMRRQRLLVTRFKRVRKLLLRLVVAGEDPAVGEEVLPEGLRGEVEPPREPEEALGGFVLFLGELAADEALQGFGEEGVREVAGAHFGDVARHVVFYGREGDAAEEVCVDFC